ncbi:hypothetical protein MUP32_06460 [Candidatus Microgenomates bacterium]|nr:hypothetical protein [Candidatus Microgenomates bacterium]
MKNKLSKIFVAFLAIFILATIILEVRNTLLRNEIEAKLNWNLNLEQVIAMIDKEITSSPQPTPKVVIPSETQEKKTCGDIVKSKINICPHDYYAFYYFSLEEPNSCLKLLIKNKKVDIGNSCIVRTDRQMKTDEAILFLMSFYSESVSNYQSMRPIVDWLKSYQDNFPDITKNTNYIAEELYVTIATYFGPNILKSHYLRMHYEGIFAEPK